MEMDGFSLLNSQASVTAKNLKPRKDIVAEDFKKSIIVLGSTSGSLNSEHLNGSNSDLSYHTNDTEAVDDDAVIEGDNLSDYDDTDDYVYDDYNDDDYLSIQAQFDNVDLPPGVEASVSWLKNMPGANALASTTIPAESETVGQPPGEWMSSLKIYTLANGKNEAANASSSSSKMLVDTSSAGKEQEEKADDVLRKFQLFKQFDTVEDFSDHHFKYIGFSGQEPPKPWTKKIQQEWKILEKHLPDTIYVRVSETRMDLLRAIIVGPAGTPYHDGLFLFDVLFPPTYPDIPPMVYYYSGGLRLNPNLYDCGKVCLSLLNTWSGQENEMWMPKTSTMLQVLVSIQALILNAKPFFNEPGYAHMHGGPQGERRSKEYNENVFILSLKTMMYTLRRPPKHFEDFVAGHFRLHAHDILSACKAYMQGAEVGSAYGGIQDTNKAEKNNPDAFRAALARMMNSLVTNFIKNGSHDCEQFRNLV